MVRHRKHSSGLALGLAAIIAGLLGFASPSTAQTITEFPIPTANAFPQGIALGSDNALWFVESGFGGVAKIGRITVSGVITEVALPTPGSVPSEIVAGPDGALWFTESQANKIGRITTSGTVTEYPIPVSGGQPTGIAAGPDGALWFALQAGCTPVCNAIGAIGRITTSGVITQFPVAEPGDIAAGADGALWFTEPFANKIGRITTSGAITEYPIPVADSLPTGITAGPDGALWFGEIGTNAIGRITTSGVVTQYALPASPIAQLSIAIRSGPDGALWFTVAPGFSSGQNSSIGRVTTSGTVAEFPTPSPNSNPAGIAAGPDGALWFTEQNGNKIGRITVPPNTSPLLAAVLPSSRSATVGNSITAFATIINSGSSPASGCAIAPVTPVPASFLYQTTNPATNALTGSPNTPANIPGNNGSQSFVFAFTANAPVVPTDVALGFDCSGIDAASSSSGLNTLLYSASATPVPDIVALSATATNDGTLHIPGSSGSNAFAVATVNVGAAAAITATANTGAASLPLMVTVCQTNPQTGQCLATPAASVSTTINANATPTFAFFASVGGQIPFLPATNRIFVQFSDAAGTVRGSTSVAVTTQ